MWKSISERPTRVPALWVMAGVLFFLAWQIVTKTMAVSYETTDPERALFWDSHDANAWLQLARRRGVSEQGTAGASMQAITEARRSAEQALRFDPVAPEALTILGGIAESAGEAPRAAALMQLAGDRALRDAVAQAWLLDRLLRRPDFVAALPHLDAIMRTHPEALDRTLPLLAAFISDLRASKPLAGLVGTGPPWRAWFLNHIPSRVANRIALQRFYAELQAGPNPLNQKELEPYLDQLVNDGLFREAYVAWVGTLPSERRGAPGMLYNGAFQFPLSGSEFDWNVEQSLGADIDVAGRTGTVPAALRVEFSGARVDFHNVSHLLMLPPGSYRLSGEVEAESLETERGLWWRLFCVGRPDPSLGQTELVAESTPWRAFALPFTVPPTSCQAQVLQLELPARVALEKAISGVVSYRNLAIVALQTGNQPSASGSKSDGRPRSAWGQKSSDDRHHRPARCKVRETQPFTRH